MDTRENPEESPRGMKGAKEEDKAPHHESIREGRGHDIEEMMIAKLMEEIVELNQELSMKQRFLSSRIKLLQRMMRRGPISPYLRQLMGSLRLKIKPYDPAKVITDYCEKHGYRASEGGGIPMQMDKGEPIPMEMDMGQPIEMPPPQAEEEPLD